MVCVGPRSPVRVACVEVAADDDEGIGVHFPQVFDPGPVNGDTVEDRRSDVY